jgi:uncharacterized protein (TIGR02118 family)
MYKLLLAFPQPPDPAAFEAAWSQEFVPRAERMAGIRKVIVSRTAERLAGEGDLYLEHAFLFDDLAAARSAMASPAGEEAGRALMGFAAGNVSILLMEHLEEDRPAGL